MKKNLLLFIGLLFCSSSFWAQDSDAYQWINIGDMKLEGRTKSTTENSFQRLPDSMKNNVRERVWELSENPAGVSLNFISDASEIIVKYQVEGVQSFPHMPATGVSGVDMYSRTGTDKWQWVRGNFHFGDTISYRFQFSNSEEILQKKELLLYLPLYASVKWMEVGIDEESEFSLMPAAKEKPIVVYGTSITQGACATRPGTAWVNMLSRDLDIPFVNLGFSGNGRLETELIEYISKTPAQMYIFDCLANFTSQELNPEKLKERTIDAVTSIRKSDPEIPILLTDHAGYPHGDVYHPSKVMYEALNAANLEAFEILKANGVDNIHLLLFENLDLSQDAFVDGIHPNDLGMRKYATAYYEKISSILK